MCGITGFLSAAADLEPLCRGMERAVDSLEHRGPDDRGVWCPGGGIGLGHRRLSILDLSPSGRQPMLSANGRWAMVYNGEVYNFRELRAELEAGGRRFHGRGDTEVVLAAFDEWGRAAAERFIGMFAIALWDRTERSLRLFRDRLGVKPLYYGWDGATLWFGSEMRALLAYPHWQPEIDRQALGEFLQYGYIAAPRAIYGAVRKLPPGHWLELSPGGAPSLGCYWRLTDRLEDLAGVREEELEERLEALLADACKLRLIADVPVGVFLSGGIDSTLVAALLQRQGAGVKTFTIGFREPAYDESRWARRVAEHLGTEHTEHIASIEDARGLLPRWGELFDEPFGDASGLPTFLVSRMARAHVKAALSADGGDELFGGYRNYRSLPARAERLRRLPAPLRSLARSLLGEGSLSTVSYLSRCWRRAGPRKIVDRLRKLRQALPGAGDDEVFDLAVCFWTPEEIGPLVGGYAPPRVRSDAYRGRFEERMMLWDLHHYLPDDILAKVDRASMSASLEGREPLLDHRVVEFAFSLPLDQRLGALGSKHILRRILYRRVPRELVLRPKQGFGIPLRQWLLDGLDGLLEEHLSPQAIRAGGFFDPRLVAAGVRDFRRGAGVDAGKVWMLLAFELWRKAWDRRS